jgi:hypothetical protein
MPHGDHVPAGLLSSARGTPSQPPSQFWRPASQARWSTLGARHLLDAAPQEDDRTSSVGWGGESEDIHVLTPGADGPAQLSGSRPHMIGRANSRTGLAVLGNGRDHCTPLGCRSCSISHFAGIAGLKLELLRGRHLRDAFLLFLWLSGFFALSPYSPSAAELTRSPQAQRGRPPRPRRAAERGPAEAGAPEGECPRRRPQAPPRPLGARPVAGVVLPQRRRGP